MSDFYTLLDEYLGNDDALSDIRVVARRCWFYDFDGYPLWLWQGKGTLFTQDGVEWLGTVDNDNVDRHKVPALQDGRDGSSPTYSFSMNVPTMDIYEELKADQWRVAGRDLVCYIAIFKEGEALRPTTPIVFLKQLTMVSVRFAEKLQADASGKIDKIYTATVTSKDGNFGRSSIPNGTYTDTIQKFRAKQYGVTVDKGCEYVASLANRTLQIP
jgi:hypothetical protein